MEILEYDQIDPQDVFQLAMLALDFALTPEYAARLRQTDPRPFPCLAVYAVENGKVLGQVGIFRLPMVTSEGREDMGGVWAVSTHPEFAGRGVASLLLDEAHRRMRLAGLRFSTLGTDRWRSAHRLYCRHGYEEMGVFGTALAPWEAARQPTRYHARHLGDEGYDFIDRLFEQVGQEYLGFAWRHTPFTRLRDRLSFEEIWVLWESDQPLGYALTQVSRSILNITSLVLKPGVDVAEAVAAVAGEVQTSYVQVKVSRPVEAASLQRLGFRVAYPDWSSFMVKPLVPEVTVEDARRLLGIGTDRFMISWLDTT